VVADDPDDDKFLACAIAADAAAIISGDPRLQLMHVDVVISEDA